MEPSQFWSSASEGGAFRLAAGKAGFLNRPLEDGLDLRDFAGAGRDLSGVCVGCLSGLGLLAGQALEADVSEGFLPIREFGVLVSSLSLALSGVPSMVDRADLYAAPYPSLSALEPGRLDDLECGRPEPSEL